MNAKFDAAIERVEAALGDGFDVGDVPVLVREAVELAETIGELDGPAKRDLAIAFVNDLIDKFFPKATPALADLVERIDWPLIPEAIERTVLDPWVRDMAAPFAKDLLKLGVPFMVDLVVDASRGKIAVNKGDYVE